MDDSLEIKTVVPSFTKKDWEVDPSLLPSRLNDIKNAGLQPLDSSANYLKKRLDEWRENGLWKHFQLSWDMFCEIELGKPVEWVDLVVDCAPEQSPDDIRKTIMQVIKKLDTLQLAINEHPPINNVGRPPKLTPEDKQKITELRSQGMTQQQIADEMNVTQSNVSSTINSIEKLDNIKVLDTIQSNTMVKSAVTDGGTSQSYLIGRLKRDHPEVLDKIGKGKEFKSARAAAIAMGILKDRPMIAVPCEPSKLAANLESKCDADYLSEVIESLDGIAVSGSSGGEIASKLYQKLDDQQLRELYTNLCDYLGNEF